MTRGRWRRRRRRRGVEIAAVAMQLGRHFFFHENCISFVAHENLYCCPGKEGGERKRRLAKERKMRWRKGFNAYTYLVHGKFRTVQKENLAIVETFRNSREF